jgi:hypothetical protein
MTFYRPDDEELKCSSWDALRRHIAQCHKEIDFLSDVRASQAAMIGKFNKGEPIKVTENGIDTWFNLPVKTPAGLVPADRTACEVRSLSLPYDKEYITSGGAVCQSNRTVIKTACGECLILLADKPAQQFEVGKCYKNRRGEIRGPLKSRNVGTCYVLEDSEGTTYTSDGVEWIGLVRPVDLLQPAVDPPPTWVPPASLPDGIYAWAGGALRISSPTFGSILFGSQFSSTAVIFRDWTDPPKVGRWQVTNGTATWLGE